MSQLAKIKINVKRKEPLPSFANGQYYKQLNGPVCDLKASVYAQIS